MIIENPNLPVETQGIEDSDINLMTIEPNAIMFDIISNKMYKDKIGTICREILSNAKDSCGDAKVTTPIDLHLPVPLEPWFSVKDYGLGLNEQDVVQIFGVYGRSTKRKSNTNIGGFGIGGKSLICLNGQFTITAVKDGKKCVYQFFKNKEGLPVNTCLNRCDTDEPNGVEAKISVSDSRQFLEFRTKSEHYIRWLDYPVNCNLKLNIDKPEFEHKEESFGITKYSQGYATIVVGTIAYHLDLSHANIKDYYGGHINGVRESHIVLFANIGDVDLVASRESLEFNEKTIKVVQNAAQKVKEFYNSYMKDKTQIWVIQNRKAWEQNQDKQVRYGFPVKQKWYGNKWSCRHESNKVFEKYVLVDDIYAKRPWGELCKRVKTTVDYIGFVNKANEQGLLDIGIEKDRIIDVDGLPKTKRGKLKKYKVYFIDAGNRLKTKRVDELEDEVVYVNSQSNKSSIKAILEDNNRTDDISFVFDETQKCGLHQYVKDKHGESLNVSYCDVVNALEKVGILKKATVPKDDGYDFLRKNHSLMRGESVDLSAELPLLKYINWGGFCNNPTAKEKEHTKFYVDHIRSKNPNLLDNKHLKVLK